MAKLGVVHRVAIPHRKRIPKRLDNAAGHRSRGRLRVLRLEPRPARPPPRAFHRDGPPNSVAQGARTGDRAGVVVVWKVVGADAQVLAGP